MKITGTLFLTLFSLLTLWQCAAPSSEVQFQLDAPPHDRLSAYQFFTGTLADLQANVNVLPYDLNTPLFTDYAHKSRYVWMPPGQSAQYTEDGVLEFPKGTVLIKHFYYLNDERQVDSDRRIIETRLLVHQTKGWEAHTYIWDEKQEDAQLEIVGDITPVSWVDIEGQQREINYLIPNKNQCKSCHSYDEQIMPIGPKARNLNRDLVYSDGPKNQLVKWTEVGYLSGYLAENESPRTAIWNSPSESLHQRALAYLDSNCGHCHNPHGPGGTTGLNLVYDAPLDLTLGINKPPVAAGRASGGLSYSIVKGQPDQSILAYRMASGETGVMMPEIGRTLVHEEGVALIREWIAAMK